MTRLALLLVTVVLLSACGNAPPPAASRTTTAPTSSGTPSSRAAPTTPVPTEPVTVDGDCFYLDTEFVEQTVGQHIERTTYTTTSHETLPSCTFYRPDGEPAADIAVTAYDTPVEAQTVAVELGTAAANPVDDLADGGVVLVSADRTVLAVSSANTLLVVTINQASSLEARVIAEQVAPLLG